LWSFLFNYETGKPTKQSITSEAKPQTNKTLLQVERFKFLTYNLNLTTIFKNLTHLWR